MATPAQATNGNNKYYKDASNNVFEAGTNRAIQLPEFQSLGLNIDHINPKIDTGQPSPETFKVGTGATGPGGEPIYDVFSGGQHVSDPNDPRLKGVNIANLQTGTAPQGFQSKFQQGFNQANSALGGQLPTSGPQAAGLVSQYSPTKTNDVMSSFVQTDPYMDGLVKSFQDYINPQNQRTSLRETYDKMLKDSGVQSIDMELVDMKRVIEGSEDDLRSEITKAGGFATESQVMALTNARNKQLIKNYNTLLDTRNAKEKYLQTSLQLEESDRQSADQRFESAFNMGTQLQQLHQQMQTNARQQMQWNADKIGFDGLYESTGGDPYYVNLVERTLGLPQGGLIQAAQQAQQAKMMAAEDRQLDLQGKKLGLQDKQLGLQLKGEQIISEQIQQKKTAADIRRIENDIALANSGGVTVDPKTGQPIVQPIKPNSLPDLVLQYRTAIENTSKVGRFFKPSTQAELDSLRGQITAVYKQEQKLGTLDAGVQKLIESIIGSGPGSKYNPGSYLGLVFPSGQSEKAILTAVDSFLTNQSGIDLTTKKKLREEMPRGNILVVNRNTREIGHIPENEFNSNLYIKI